MARRPEFTLKEEYAEMPRGSHVTPVRPSYLNRDTFRELEEDYQLTLDPERMEQIRISRDYNGIIMNETVLIVCYTARGFHMIPKDLIEER